MKLYVKEKSIVMKEEDKRNWSTWVEDHYDQSRNALDDDSKEVALILDALKRLTPPLMDEEALFEKIQERKVQVERSTPKIISLKKWFYGAAAVITLLFAATFLVLRSTQVQALAVEQISHQLPDGSTVHLNAGSLINYESNFSNNRIINLDGEAFFEVQKGSPFTVQTPNGDIHVLGTSFNVYSFDNHLSVACKSGKVSVTASSFSPVDLLPGEQVKIGERIDRSKIDIQQVNAWQKGNPYFSKAPLKEVVHSLTKQYNIKIELPLDYQNKIYTGTFVNNNLSKALKMVFLPMDIEYKLEGKDRVVIK